MSNENSNMTRLLKKQEAERNDLAAGAYEAWQPVREQEEKLLLPYGGKYENAPEGIQAQVNEARHTYFIEWGSDGKLAALMDARHSKERERVAEKQKILDRIKQTQTKHMGNEGGR